MKNALLEPVEYKVEETRRGVWRRFLYPTGELFEEFTSHRRLFGLPLLHFTRGKSPETGKRVTARGIIAVGRFAVGIIALGQVSAGILAIGQLSLGLLFGLGQAATGVLAIGQLAIAGLFGLGQFASGYAVIAQFGVGKYVLAQTGMGSHVWDTNGESPVARQFFESLLPWTRGIPHDPSRPFNTRWGGAGSPASGSHHRTGTGERPQTPGLPSRRCVRPRRLRP
jgi:hypothetical protein